MHTKERFLTRLETEAALDKLGGVDGVLDFIKPAPQIVDPTWERVVVGTLGDAGSARKKLSERGIEIDKQANQILDQVKFGGYKKTINLSLMTVKSLDLEEVTTEKIMVRARSYGLHPCPPEVAIQILLQHPRPLSDREKGSVLIGMSPLTPPGIRTKWLFQIEENCLSADTGHPQDLSLIHISEPTRPY